MHIIVEADGMLFVRPRKITRGDSRTVALADPPIPGLRPGPTGLESGLFSSSGQSDCRGADLGDLSHRYRRDRGQR